MAKHPSMKEAEKVMERTARTAEAVANIISLEDAAKKKQERPSHTTQKIECETEIMPFRVLQGILFQPAPDNRPELMEPAQPLQYGACRYCGQAQNLPYKLYDPDEANDYATRHCKCAEAMVYQDHLAAVEKRQRALDEVNLNLKTLFGDVKSEEIMENLREAAELVYDRKIVSLNLKLTYTIAAKISRNSKGNIAIERKDAMAQKVEV